MRRLALLIAMSPMALPAADIEPCLECHGGDTAAAEVAPTLDGQRAEYLRIQLLRYRDGERPSFPMEHLVKGLDDVTIAVIAANFAVRPWFDHPGPVDGERIARGAELAQQGGCADCHGERLRGDGAVPRLAGQNAVYLTQQIGAFATQQREHPPFAGKTFDATEAAALAAWLSALR